MHFQFDSLLLTIRSNFLIAVTIAYITGATLAKYWQVDSILLRSLSVILILAYLILFLFHRKRLAIFFLLLLFAFTGFIHTSNGLLPPQDPSHLYNAVPERKKMTLTGRVLNMPEFKSQKTRFDMAADSILIHSDQPGSGEPKLVTGKVRLSLEGVLERGLQPGDQIMVLASVSRTYNYRTPGVFDYRLYLADKNIHVSGKIHSQLDVLPFKDIHPSRIMHIRSAPERWRSKIGTFLQNRLDPSTVGIYKALLIGSRSDISDATLERFKASGCMHLLAISGIHMSLLGLIITLSLTWLMKRSSWLLLHTHVPTVATFLSILPLIMYAFIAGMNTPVLRSLIMSCFFLIGVILQRQRSILVIIAAAALFLLIWKPLALFTVSFQLSFGSILAIAVFYPRLLQKIEQINDPERNTFVPYISSALLVSVAASLGALPFMLFHFNRFSFIGPVMNLLVEPFLCLWALPLGLLAIPFIFLAPSLAALLLEFGSYGILAADKITLAGSTIPIASFWTISPSIPEIILFYFLLFLLLRQAGSVRNKTFYGMLLTGLICVFVHGKYFSLPTQTTELAFLDVGQGSSSMVRLPSGRVFLIDGGSKTSPTFNIGERVISPFLWKKRIWKVDDIIITHPDSDHANGIDTILKHFKPDRLWINGDKKTSWPYSKTLRLASDLGITIIEPDTGAAIEDTPDTLLTFVQGADSTYPGSSVNDRSLVIKLDHKDRSFLFPGDISKEREEILIKDGADVRADLLLAPHHGSKGSGSWEFINRVDPDIILISAGKKYRRRYQDPAHLTNWQEKGITVLTTSDHGTISCLSDGKTLSISTFVKKSVMEKNKKNQDKTPEILSTPQ